MNVVAASLRIRERAIPFVHQLVEAARTGATFQTVRRRCLRIGEYLGFIFGNGLMANFLGEYYGTGKYGPARAAWLLLRACGSAVIGGPFVKKLFKRFEGTLELDGQLLERTSFVGRGRGDRPGGRPGVQAQSPRRRRPGALRIFGHPRPPHRHHPGFRRGAPGQGGRAQPGDERRRLDAAGDAERGNDVVHDRR